MPVPTDVCEKFQQILQGDPFGKTVLRIGSTSLANNLIQILALNNKVGCVVLKDPDSGWTLRVVIRPKIAGSVTGMLDAVLRAPGANPAETQDGVAEETPSRWLAALYVRRLEEFLPQLRPWAEEKADDVVGSVRGRPLIDAYVARNWRGRRHVMPCRYLEWTSDNLPNRILLGALRAARRILALAVAGPEGEAVVGRMLKCEAAFAGVSVCRISGDDMACIRGLLVGPFHAYREVCSLAMQVILSIDPLAMQGPNTYALPYLSCGSSQCGNLHWDVVVMPDLFQCYVRTVLDPQHPVPVPLQIRRSTYGGQAAPCLASIRDLNARLDCVPYGASDGHGGIVLDAKYKVITAAASPGSVLTVDNVGKVASVNLAENRDCDLAGNEPVDVGPGGKDMDGEGSSGSGDGNPVENADIYQVASYASHVDICARAAGLVYPVAGSTAGSGIPYYSDLGHGIEGNQGRRVYILTVRIDAAGIDSEMNGAAGMLRSQVNAILEAPAL